MTPTYVVGLGGTTRANSSTEKAIAWVLRDLERRGATTRLIKGAELDLPPYRPGMEHLPPAARDLVAELRKADGVILGTPGYHGGISGLVKNAIDYIEEMRADERPYLDGRVVGCIVTAAGDQGAVMTLSALRSVVHALRGWPTPMGVSIITTESVFDDRGECITPRVRSNLQILSQQVMRMAGGDVRAGVAS
jgi:FMN reductase